MASSSSKGNEKTCTSFMVYIVKIVGVHRDIEVIYVMENVRTLHKV